MLLFGNKRKKSSKVITVKLLPEKEKRDHILRFVSYILILITIIVNVFFIYLPRLDVIGDVHDKKEALHNLKVNYALVNDELSGINKELYDLNKNRDIAKIENQNLDFYSVVEDIEALQPSHSFIENINFTDGGFSIVMTIQFDTYFDLTQFHKKLTEIEYVTSAEAGSISIIEVDNPDYLDRVKTNFKLELDTETSPKAGGIYE